MEPEGLKKVMKILRWKKLKEAHKRNPNGAHKETYDFIQVYQV